MGQEGPRRRAWGPEHQLPWGLQKQIEKKLEINQINKDNDNNYQFWYFLLTSWLGRTVV